MSKRIVFFVVFLVFVRISGFGQIDKFTGMDLHPVSPSAFQFLKYTELPVSEYTGIPGISVPLYNISADGVNIPVGLSYHSQGIRPTQEASWVGLGWDLTIGSIVQHINDKDDYALVDEDLNQTIVKRLPDYFHSYGDGQPTTLPMRRSYPSLYPGSGWSNPYPITTYDHKPGYAIATNYYVPVNGEFDTQQDKMFNEPWFDSEPDIFTANFLGHSVSFSIDFISKKFVVLKGKGYKVEQSSNPEGFKITDRTGVVYWFELKSPVKNHSTWHTLEGGSSNSASLSTVSNIYYLTKVVTVRKRVITFEYESSGLNENYPAYSDKLAVLTDLSPYAGAAPTGYGNYLEINSTQSPQSGTMASYSYNQETLYHLRKIYFPEGTVDFLSSVRTDVTGGKKLDHVILRNSNTEVVKQWGLNYSYSDASNITGNGFTHNTGANLSNETRSSLRLKLNSVIELNGDVYSFVYNNTPLPKKNSFAQDYWGFYNGKLSNTSLSPNPTALGYSTLGNNNNDKNADINYIKAEILEQVIYPTGGKVVFNYELNQLDKGQMHGLPSSTQYIPGAGLRIASVEHYEKAGNTVPTLKKVYNYEGGKLLQAKRLYRTLPYSYFSYHNTSSGIVHWASYSYHEFSSNGNFTSNPLLSGSGVGYDKVTVSDVDPNGMSIGKIVTEFSNNINTQNPTIETRAVNFTIPETGDLTKEENGVVMVKSIFDRNNTLVKKDEHVYNKYISYCGYGAKFYQYKSLMYRSADGSGVYSSVFIPQHLLAYYPVYSISSLPYQTKTTEYDNAGNTIVNISETHLDYYNGTLIAERKLGLDNKWNENKYRYVVDEPGNPFYNQLLAANRLSDLVSANEILAGTTSSTDFKVLSEYTKEYIVSNGHIVPGKVTAMERLQAGKTPRQTTFDAYDNNANLLQTTTNGLTQSMIWDYYGERLVAEVKNAVYNDVAYSSFEGYYPLNVAGNWALDFYFISADNTAPTGKRYYNLRPASTLGKNGLTASTTYIISYWSKDGSYSVTGSSTVVTGKVLNGWTYYEHTVSGTTNVSISGSGSIDEVRLYPKGALMATYTHLPLIGLESQVDPNNHVIYYEYDAKNRLKLLRDENRNIIKQYDYKYQYPEPTGYALWQETGAMRCKPCPINNAYITNTIQYEVKDMNTLSPTYNMTKWTDGSDNSACVVNADWQNTATAIRCKKNMANENTGEQEQEQVNMNPCHSTYGQKRWIVVGYDATLCPVPVPACNGTCIGMNKKCINNVCETGVRVNKSAVWDKYSQMWLCTYYYQWSDGSTSADYTELNTYHCLFTGA